jgi:hypothetical protein
VVKPPEKQSNEISRMRWKDNININLMTYEEMRCPVADCAAQWGHNVAAVLKNCV